MIKDFGSTQSGGNDMLNSISTPDFGTMPDTSSKENPASMLPPATGTSMINVGKAERIISAIGGAALTYLSTRNVRNPANIGMLLGGTYLLTRGISGYCAINNMMKRDTSTQKTSAVEITKTFTVNKPKNQIYAFWRKLENLPTFMEHLKEVKELNDTRSTWTASLPGGIGSVSWEAEITEDISGEMLSWRSLPGSTIDNAGTVLFRNGNGDNDTILQVRISYRLPAGDIGTLAGKFFNPAVKAMVKKDVKRFKNYMESGTLQEENSSTPNTGGSKQKRSKAFIQSQVL